jgi:hypothetical protein
LVLSHLSLSTFFQDYNKCDSEEEICLINFEQAIIDYSKNKKLIYMVFNIDDLDDELVDILVTNFFKEFSSLLINNRLPYYKKENQRQFKKLQFIQEKINEILKIESE